MHENKTHLLKKFIILSITLFVFILVVGSAIFIFSMQNIVKSNKGNELLQMLEFQRIKLENSISSEIAIVLKLADSPLIKRYFADPSDSEIERYVLEEIIAYRRAFSSFSVFWINDIDMIFYSDDNDTYVVDPADSSNYWYNMTLYETEVYNFNINFNTELNAAKLWINAPVFDDNHKSLGMVGTGIELSTYIDMIYQSIDDRVELYLFNEVGEITGSKDVEDVVAKNKIEKELSGVNINILDEVKSLQPEESRTFDTSFGKIAIGTIPVLGWYTIAIAPVGIKNYDPTMIALFVVMLIVIALILIIFNVFIAGFLKSLKKTMDSLESASMAKSDFLARMSHEIRTPMNAIIGITELVLREDNSPNIHEHVMDIKNAGNNLLSIINDILDFSKIESGKMEIIPTEYLFASLINDVINIIRIRTAEKSVFFVVNLDSLIPDKMIGDEVRVRQILLNLLSNAVKYTNEGFISMTIEGEIRDDNTVLLNIEVSDSGIGIRPEDINKLFGDFVQVDMTSHKGVQGTGLGLAITRSLISAMGGDISVYSQYGQGSTFTMLLPQKYGEYEKFASVVNPDEKKVLLYEPRGIYADSIACSIDNLGVECVLVQDREKFHEALKSADYPFVFVSSFLFESAKKIISEVGVNPSLVLLAEYGEAVAEKNIKTIAMPVHSISIANILNDVTDIAGYGGSESINITFSAPSARVLIVDDIPTNLKVAEGLMAPYNMRIDTCLSGEAAIELVRSGEYDLIFMDHMMPGMDGIEAAKRIRALGGAYCASVPIVALTANALSGVREMFMQNGMNDFLAKPIDTSKLNSVLEQWIPRKKKEDQTVQKIKLSPAPFVIEGLDVKAGIMATGGDTNHYITTLSLICSDIREKLTQIRDCMESEDIRLYTTYVHALKSALASIGARELSDLAGKLEAAGRNGNTAFISQNTELFLQELAVLLKNIAQTVSSRQESNMAQEKIDKTLLVRLKKALDEIDAISTGEIIKELQSKNWGKELNGAIEEINQNILIFEYDEAQAVIDKLLIQQEGC